MSDPTVQDIANKLLTSGFPSAGAATPELTDPIADTPMVVTIDELRPYELNPRLTRNPLYDEIKDSIRERGLDAPPPITRRPGATHYIIRNGGNTRLAILRELWSETKDERFFRISCLFRPWPERGEIVALTGHLAENELHGGLSFIERALGVEKARELYEQENGEPLSQSELARRLSADGYPVPQPHISRMQDTVRYLLPAIPTVLYGGLGRHQAERLAVLRKTAELAWHQHAHKKSISEDFELLFHEVLASFDGQATVFNIKRVQDELIGRMAELLGKDYNALELDIVSIEHRQRVLTSPPQPVPSDEESAASSGTPSSPEPSAPASTSAGDLPSGRTLFPPSLGETAKTPGSATPEIPIDRHKPAGEHDTTTRVQAHIISPAATTERLQAIQQLVAEHTGEEHPSFTDNALRAIPVQVGGLFPITDVWYIEPGLDSPDRLRTHIAQFAREIAEEVMLADTVEPSNSGIGFSCTTPVHFIQDQDPSAQTLLALLQVLSQTGSDVPSSSSLDDLGAVLLGSSPNNTSFTTRLSDSGLVKLFRLLRLGRHLVDMEAKKGGIS